ncbi:jg11786 [Pararge aegeria aegeria]|uniref:Jg11786 protein n=1 Tax=Pararge aegeria aegeria TaxID=348720 RepID=A0A8S4SE27_9NEOP|nr:jg11786 [Pararge aegeria aegeria]
MEAERAFQILAVRIRNEDAERLVRVRELFVTELVRGSFTAMLTSTAKQHCCHQAALLCCGLKGVVAGVITGA